MSLSEEAFISGANSKSKIERYGWTLRDEPGLLTELNKEVIHVDRAYQREATEAKVLRMAGTWSWVSCGVITVAKRNGKYYAIDGQHRVLASRRRADITTLPCIVFESISRKKEAEGFLQANTNRKPMTGVEKFKAMLVTEDEDALFIQRICEEWGREIKRTPGPGNIGCVILLLKLAKNSRDILERLWPVLMTLSEGKTINNQFIEGMVYLEQNLPDGESLSRGEWKKRAMRVGYDRLLDAARKAAAYYTKGGARVYADGMLQALNYNCRKKMRLETDVAA